MITNIIIGILILALFIVLFGAKIRIGNLEKKLEIQNRAFENEKKDVRKDAKKRSGAVQWGKTIEHFVPFTSAFPVPIENVTFIGMPIDYIGFTDTDDSLLSGVHLIEVKSGNSMLSMKQENIKKAVLEGRVYWHELSVEKNNIIVE